MGAVAALIGSGELSEAEVEELECMLQDRKQRSRKPSGENKAAFHNGPLQG